jgi:hypothetical protein
MAVAAMIEMMEEVKATELSGGVRASFAIQSMNLELRLAKDRR